MQKINFISSLSIIIRNLKSEDVHAIFLDSLTTPSDKSYKYSAVIPLLFISKSNFDNLIKDPQYKNILVSIGASKYYNEEYLSQITSLLTDSSPYYLIRETKVREFFIFHEMLLQLFFIAKRHLIDEDYIYSYESQINLGIISFQIIIESEGLDAEIYAEIFTALKKLIVIISKINQSNDETAEIILLDSGSDANILLKSTVENARSLFLIFKEIFEFVTSFRFYKQRQKNQALLDGLNIMSEIKAKVDAQVLTEDQGKEYSHYIKTQTDKLLGYKVIPTQLLLNSADLTKEQLLIEMKETKLLAMNNESNEHDVNN